MCALPERGRGEFGRRIRRREPIGAVERAYSRLKIWITKKRRDRWAADLAKKEVFQEEIMWIHTCNVTLSRSLVNRCFVCMTRTECWRIEATCRDDRVYDDRIDWCCDGWTSLILWRVEANGNNNPNRVKSEKKSWRDSTSAHFLFLVLVRLIHLSLVEWCCTIQQQQQQ